MECDHEEHVSTFFKIVAKILFFKYLNFIIRNAEFVKNATLHEMLHTTNSALHFTNNSLISYLAPESAQGLLADPFQTIRHLFRQV